MNCREFSSRLETLHDRREAPSQALRDHAASCPACDRALRADEALRRGLEALQRQARGVAIPEGFAQETRRRARAAEAPARQGFTWPIAAGIALAAAVLAVAVLSVDAPIATRPAGVASVAPAQAGAAHDAGAVPVLYSNGGVDIVAPQAEAAATPDPSRVAVLVEWNL